MIFDEYYRRTWTDEDISPAQTAHAAALRIPYLRNEYPRWNYITGVVVHDEQYHETGIAPTDDEVVEIADWLTEYNRYFNAQFIAAMRTLAPFDIDGGANLGYLLKRGDGDWAYRKRTFRYGPHWVPSKEQGRPWSLTETLRRNFDGWSFAKDGA